MSKFRIFISSPVAGFEAYRNAIKQAAKDARHAGLFDFFIYEEHEILTREFANPCDAIFDVAGHDFDAIFIFFKDRVGEGTLAELRYFEEHILPKRSGCRVWWSKVESTVPYERSVGDLLSALSNRHALEIPEGSDPRNIEPEHLRGRFTLKLWQQTAALREA